MLVLVHSVTLFVVLLVIVIHDVYAVNDEKSRTVIVCLDYPGQSLALDLSCSNDSLQQIYVTNVFHGSLVLLDTSNYSAACNWSNFNMSSMTSCNDSSPYTGFVFDACMSRENCSIDVAEMPQILYSCQGLTTNLLAVTYTCLSGDVDNDVYRSFDVCGGDSASDVTSGYITSPDYPVRYPPDSICTCRIVTTIEEAQVLLQVLDVSMSSRPNDYSPADWVEYTRSSDDPYWSSGRRFEATDISLNNYYISTSSNVVNVNFQSDSAYEERGFWLAFKGQDNNNSSDVHLNITCGIYSPSTIRHYTACLDSPSNNAELYLTCRPFGVINIVQVWRGTATAADVTSSSSSCHQPTCLQLDDDDVIDDLMQSCAALPVCNPPVVNSNVSGCGNWTSYIQIDYRCIDGERVDVCGLGRNDLTTPVGYISSPNYPNYYSPNIDCCCHLNTEDADSKFHLMLTPGDKFEYYNLDDFKRQSLAAMNNVVPLYTDSPAVGLHFQTDSSGEDRGFWIQFVGRSLDGDNVDVFVTCHTADYCSSDQLPTTSGHVTNITWSTPSMSTTADNDIVDKLPRETNSNTNAMIIGVTILCLVLVAVLIAAACFCRHYRYRKHCTTDVTPACSEAMNDLRCSPKQHQLHETIATVGTRSSSVRYVSWSGSPDDKMATVGVDNGETSDQQDVELSFENPAFPGDSQTSSAIEY